MGTSGVSTSDCQIDTSHHYTSAVSCQHTPAHFASCTVCALQVRCNDSNLMKSQRGKRKMAVGFFIVLRQKVSCRALQQNSQVLFLFVSVFAVLLAVCALQGTGGHR